MRNESVRTLEQRRAAVLKRLAELGPFVQGSFCERTIRCGKPGCRCSQGEPHRAYVLTRKVRGKTVTTHVPRDLRQEVVAWANEYKRIKQLLSQVSALSDRIIRIHVRTCRAAARNRRRAKSTPVPLTKGSCATTSRGSSTG